MTTGTTEAVSIIEAWMIQLTCPYCGARQEGFLSDPRGGSFDCDDCGRPYSVSESAEVKIV